MHSQLFVRIDCIARQNLTFLSEAPSDKDTYIPVGRCSFSMDTFAATAAYNIYVRVAIAASKANRFAIP